MGLDDALRSVISEEVRQGRVCQLLSAVYGQMGSPERARLQVLG